MKLFIDGISSVTAEKDLEDYFGHYGRIVEIVLCRELDFGYISFAHQTLVLHVMDEEWYSYAGRVFIGRRPNELPPAEEDLKDHFGFYGLVDKIDFVRDPNITALVNFTNPPATKRIPPLCHIINNVRVEVEIALSWEKLQSSARSGTGRGGGGGDTTRANKLLVCGLPSTSTPVEFLQYFCRYGELTDVVVVYHSQTRRRCGFGFVTFLKDESVDDVLLEDFHMLKGEVLAIELVHPEEFLHTHYIPLSIGGTVTTSE